MITVDKEECLIDGSANELMEELLFVILSLIKGGVCDLNAILGIAAACSKVTDEEWEEKTITEVKK